MKKTIISVFSFCIVINVTFAQIESCNYITSHYYQKISEATIASLRENTKESYRILSEITNTCELRNSITYYELFNYATLSLKYNHYLEAYNAILSLVKNYGYQLQDFQGCKNYRKLHTLKDWKNLKRALSEQEKCFVADTLLYNEIDQMFKDDQYHREIYTQERSIAKKNKDSIAIGLLDMEYSNIFDSIDNQNFQKLLTIINTKGFPLSTNNKFNKIARNQVYVALLTIIMHSTDSMRMCVLKPLLLQYIAKGECPPEFLASMVDRQKLGAHKPYIYGTYQNISPEEIFEYEKIDERREAIGLPKFNTTEEVFQLRRKK
jgi:hypothetical protein